MWAGFHGNALLEAFFDQISTRRGIQVGISLVRAAAESFQMNPVTIKSDLQVMRRLQATNDVHGLAIQLGPNDVFPVDREVVVDKESATRSDRQSLNVVIL